MNKSNIIAHRGIFDNIDILENTIESFAIAIDDNTDIELDIQLTKDNQLVIFHDYDLNRMANTNKTVQSSTYDEIKNIKLINNKSTIPLLKEVLKLNKDKVKIYIELKNTKRIKETCEELKKELSGYSNYCFQSFNPKILRYLKKLFPDKTTAYLMKQNFPNKFISKILLSKASIKYSKADYLSIHKKLLHRRKFKRLSHKYKFLIWSIKNLEEVKNDNNLYICNIPYKKKPKKGNYEVNSK